MSDTTIGPSAPLNGWMVLAMLGGFFAVVFAVNGLMAYDAISTFRGEVAPHPYEDGLAYNSRDRGGRGADRPALEGRRHARRRRARHLPRRRRPAADGAQRHRRLRRAGGPEARPRVSRCRSAAPGVYVADVAPPRRSLGPAAAQPRRGGRGPVPIEQPRHAAMNPQGAVREVDFAVQGVTCAACIGVIENAVAALPGAPQARLNYATRRLRVRWSDGDFEPARDRCGSGAAGLSRAPVRDGRGRARRGRAACSICCAASPSRASRR